MDESRQVPLEHEGPGVGAPLMGEPKAYPVPDRPRWATMIQMMDGTQIVGTDDEDVLRRWRSLGMWSVGREMSRQAHQERVAAFARAIYGAVLIGIGRRTEPADFLDALAAEGIIQVIRK